MYRNYANRLLIGYISVQKSSIDLRATGIALKHHCGSINVNLTTKTGTPECQKIKKDILLHANGS